MGWLEEAKEIIEDIENVCGAVGVSWDRVTIKKSILDRLMAIAEGAEQAEDGEGNLFCPICGVFWAHWSHDRSKLAIQYDDDIHLITCPWSPKYEPTA